MKKQALNTWFSIALVASGAVLSFLGFYTEPIGEISDSVLWYFAQTLIYAGTAFGMKSYVDYRINKDLPK